MLSKIALTLVASYFLFPAISYSQTTPMDLNRRELGMAWPKGLEPANADLFNHNQMFMEQNCEVIYSWLSVPQGWPEWLIFVRDIQVDKKKPLMSKGSRFKFTIFGFPIEAEVYIAEPGRRLGYTLTPPGPPPQYTQSWLLTPQGTGCKVTTEEIGIGEMARKSGSDGYKLVHLAHDLWLASLRFVSRSGPRPTK